MSKYEHELFNSAKSCKDEGIFNTTNFEPCVRFKGCIPCPSHGICAENGTLLACDPTYEIKNRICVENEEIANAAYTLLWVSSKFIIIVFIGIWGEASEKIGSLKLYQ